MNQPNTSSTKKYWWLSLLPERRLLWVVGALALLGLLPALMPSTEWTWLFGALLLLLIAVFDALTLVRQARTQPIQIRREVANNLALGVETPVKLRLYWQADGAVKLAVRLLIHDWHPERTSAPHARQMGVFNIGQAYTMSYALMTHQRGQADFTGVEVHYFSRLGLWRWRSLLPVFSRVRVLPNFARIAHYRLLATANRLSDLGMLKVQRRGQGTEFDHLRDFRDGDSMRQIHWQASSAQNRLIAKEYQAERDQQIIFMLDTSRRMWHKDSQESLLDEALNSAMLLAHVAANQGDAVGMMTMGTGVAEDTDIHVRWSAPRKGARAVSQLMNQFYDVHAQPQAVDYLSAAQYLLARHKKRSLIVVLTNTHNDDFGDVQLALKLLRQKHLVILADIRERALLHAIAKDVQDMDDAVTFHAAQDYLAQRWQQHTQLRHQGLLVLDVEAQALPLRLVSQYWQLKESEQF